MEIISKEDKKLYDNLITGRDGKVFIKNIPLLTSEQVKELIELRDQGYNDAITKLVLHNLGLIPKIAMRYMNSHNSYEDLFQEGVIGLIVAAKKYDITKNASFGTYAYFWVFQKISKANYDNNGLISIPTWVEENERKISFAQDRYRNAFKKEPSIEEISKVTGIDCDEVNFILNLHNRIESFNESATEENRILIDTIPNKNAENPEDKIKKLDFQIVDKVFNLLTDREKQVIELLYGFKSGYKLTQNEVAKILNLSHQRIQQIEANSLTKIRKNREIKELIDSLDGYYDTLGIDKTELQKYGFSDRKGKCSRANVIDYFDEYSETEIRTAIDKLSPEIQKLFFECYDSSLQRRDNCNLNKREKQRVTNSFTTMQKILDGNYKVKKYQKVTS